MSITQLPLPPSRQDPNNFAQRADEFLGALPTFATELNATAATVSSQSASVTALYDSFDDRYLGPKANAPALDNDGNALLIGALYWNTGFSDMRVWTGTAWVPLQTASAATNAANILTQVETVAAAAETSASLAQTTYDAFDDRYLGAKSTAPSTDNDGNVLIIGALYWNTSTNELFIWTGSTWNGLGSGVTAFNGRNGSVVLNQTDIESALSAATALSIPNLTVTGNFLRPATVESIYEPAYTPGMRDDIIFHNWGVSGFIGGEIKDVVVQPDGKIICVGSFTSYNGDSRNGIVRIGPTGEQDTRYSSFIDTTFSIGTGFNGIVETVALQSNGKIICGGNFTEYNGTTVGRIARLNEDGSLDNTFVNGSGFSQVVHSVAVDTNGKIIVGGNFTSYAGTNYNRIIRLNANGGRDSTFAIGTGCDQTVRKVVIAPDGKVLLGGDFDFFNDNLNQGIVRLNTNGFRDSTFNPTAVVGSNNPGVNGEVYAIAVQSNNRILVGGAFGTYNGASVSSGIIRINSNGSIDTSFSAGTVGVDTGGVFAITIQPDGKILLGGIFSFYASEVGDAGNFVRVNSNGTRDTTFVTGNGFNGKVNAVKLTTRTRAIVVGDFTYYGSLTTQIRDITAVYYASYAGLNIEPPTTGEAGYLRYNRNSNSYQAYNGTEWAHLHKVTPAPRIIDAGSSIDVDFTGPDFVVFASSSAGGAVVSGVNYRAGSSVSVQVKNPYSNARTLTFPSNWIFVTTKPTELAANKTALLTLRSFGTTEADCIATWQTN